MRVAVAALAIALACAAASAQDLSTNFKVRHTATLNMHGTYAVLIH